jgi:two-component system, NtrC family, nitrogen regulation sensor histidine kinase NtrY
MISNGLRLGTLLRLALIFITMAALTWLAQQQNVRAACIGLGLLLIAQVWWLITFLERPLRDLNDFFNALHYEDLNYKFTPKVHTHLSQQLTENMHNIQQRLRELHQHKQELTHYYSLLLERVPVALLVIEGEQVTLLNNAATRLLQRSGFASFAALAQTHPGLARALQRIMPGEKCHAEVQLDAEGAAQTLSLCATQLSLVSGVKKLVSLQLIQQELDEQEIHAWQNLVQVFTHEIMNSMTPVTSLSQTAQTLLEELEQDARQNSNADRTAAHTHPALHTEKLQDAHQAVATVTRRAQHLLEFVQAYRQVLNPPTPQFARVQIQPLLQHVLELFEPQAKLHNIQLSCSCKPPSLSINADAALLEQALINLLKNALEAVTETPDGHIQLSASINTHNAPLIEIKDNGSGINPDQLDKIFIPFYTSKRAGTGIGLFLVKQIMQAHRGSVYALPNLKKGAVIKLVF